MTATASCAPDPLAAAHSRRALTPISRLMITQAAVGISHEIDSDARRMSTAATMSLSATGSKKAPKGVVACHLRARYPSKKSVRDASTKVSVHTREALGRGENQTAMRAGMARTRATVSMVGSRCWSDNDVDDVDDVDDDDDDEEEEEEEEEEGGAAWQVEGGLGREYSVSCIDGKGYCWRKYRRKTDDGRIKGRCEGAVGVGSRGRRPVGRWSRDVIAPCPTPSARQGSKWARFRLK